MKSIDEILTNTDDNTPRFYISISERLPFNEIVDRECGDSVCETFQAQGCDAQYICDALNEKHAAHRFKDRLLEQGAYDGLEGVKENELRRQLQNIRHMTLQIAERYGVMINAVEAFLADDIPWPDDVASKVLPHIRAFREAVDLPKKSRSES